MPKRATTIKQKKEVVKRLEKQVDEYFEFKYKELTDKIESTFPKENK